MTTRSATLIVIAFTTIAMAADALMPLDIRQVKVGGEIGRRIDITMHNNLAVIDIDKLFLTPFQQRTSKDGYIGLGKLIDSVSRLAAYSGDAKMLALRKHLIDRTLALQEADGYPGLMEPGSRMWRLWDIHEIQYIAWGLLTDHQYFGEQRCLDAARKIGDYILERWATQPEKWGGEVSVNVAVTGLERTMIELHRRTADRKYLDFVLRQRNLPQWDTPIVIGRREGIEGHIYAYLARCLAQLELHRIQPSLTLLDRTRKAMHFLVHENGMLISGAAGQWEIWTDDQDGRGALGETCATAYQIRVADSMLRLEGNSRYGDLIERMMYNALFAAQSPDGRRIRYYAPLEGVREYHPTDTYCCPCNYRRIVAELPGMVYYRTPGGVAVNLYAASQAKLEIAGTSVELSQETDYPNSGTVTLHVNPQRPVEFGLRLRIPQWAQNASLRINGRAEAGQLPPGRFREIQRAWRNGDKVELDLPMEFRLVKGRQRQAGRVAVMRGPVLFCLNPAQNPAIEKYDGADLGQFTLRLASAKAEKSTAVRPDGLACRVDAWKPGYSTSPRPEFVLLLTEFPDPGGKATYFRVRDLGVGVDDELLGPRTPE